MQEHPRAIFGAGKQAQHVLSLLEWMGQPWKDCILFDDLYRETKLGARSLPIAGTLRDGIEQCHKHKLSAIVALGSRNAALRYALFQSATRAGIELVNLIHPSCVLAPTSRIGRNVVLMPGCVVGPASVVGSLCCLFSNVTVEHDCVIGDNVVIGPGAALSGYVHVGAHCFLGTGSVCAPAVKVESRTLVGSGAVVVSDMPVESVCFGVPARVTRAVEPGDDVPTFAQLQELSFDLD